MMTDTTQRSGILIVEDQMLLAMELSFSVEKEGLQPLGPCTNVKTAMEKLSQNTPQAALLDINLGSGTTSEPIAEELSRRQVPFAFLTAYSKDIPIVRKFPNALYASKPVNSFELKRLLEGLLSLGE